MEVIEHIYLAPRNFQAQVSIGARSHRSVGIRFTSKENYRKAWSEPTWRIGDDVMHTSRWTPRMTGISRGRSQAMVPLWIGFLGLPVHLFMPKALQSLAAAVGTFIRLDPGVAVFTARDMREYVLRWTYWSLFTVLFLYRMGMRVFPNL